MNWQKFNIFYQTATDAAQRSPVVVLLHGASSSSQVWNELKTMHLIAAMGHRVIAVDLPGTVYYKLHNCAVNVVSNSYTRVQFSTQTVLM